MEINEKRRVLRSKECPQGRIFEVGEEIPDGWARHVPKEKKKRTYKKRAVKTTAG